MAVLYSASGPLATSVVLPDWSPSHRAFGNINGGWSLARQSLHERRENPVSAIIWIVAIGFVAGVIARFLSPGPNKPTGFVLTVALGIAGSFLATFIGQAIGWYRPDQGAGFV